MHLNKVIITNHPILKDLSIDLNNKKTGKPFSIIAFVGENGCGKTTLLNELFNYNTSNYIANKQVNENNIVSFKPLFLRQNSLYTLSQNELVTKISGGKVPFPINIVSHTDSELLLNKESKLINKDISSLFNDEVILNAYLDGRLSGIKCGGEALKLIDDSQSEIDLTKLSSGQQELLLKMSVLQNIVKSTDYILFDEPETSLHPRWQKSIIKLFKEMISNQNGETPQIFVATHSERILESLLEMDDVLIIHFSKENGLINTDIINQNLIFLPKLTFAELDYVIFNIPSYEYHDHLFTYYSDLIGSDSVSYIDKQIQKNNLYNSNYFKKWEGKKKKWNNITKQHEIVPSFTATIPCYIRNYFHHPKEGTEPSQDELSKSIDFLRKLIKEQT